MISKPLVRLPRTLKTMNAGIPIVPVKIATPLSVYRAMAL
jgi:hypothetical protein